MPRADVAQFYADFWGKPGPLNHGHTIHEYWMEQSRGKVGIPKIDVFGPYRMPRKLFEYGLNEYNQASGCPTGYTCDGRMERDADALWRADAGAAVVSSYPIKLRIYAGYDETTVWQEFGEMKFASRDDIPEMWGNPGQDEAALGDDAVRAVDVVAGRRAAVGPVVGAAGRELGHDHARARPQRLQRRRQQQQSVRHAVPPRRHRAVGHDGPRLVQRARRSASPLGRAGRRRRGDAGRPDAAQPAGDGRDAGRSRSLRVSRNALASSGPVVRDASPRARWSRPPDRWAGLIVRLDGDAPQDRTPACDRNADPLCAGDPVFNDYSVEVVQRIGYDSFTPDSGVLLAKNKDTADRTRAATAATPG